MNNQECLDLQGTNVQSHLSIFWECCDVFERVRKSHGTQKTLLRQGQVRTIFLDYEVLIEKWGNREGFL